MNIKTSPPRWVDEPRPHDWSPPLFHRCSIDGYLFEVQGLWAGRALVSCFHPDDTDTPSFAVKMPYEAVDAFVVGYAALGGALGGVEELPSRGIRRSLSIPER